MRRIFAILLTLAMLLSMLAGCGQKTEQPQESSSEQQKTDVTSEVNAPSKEDETKEDESKDGPITTDPITIDILCSVENDQAIDANEQWFWKYLEYWMEQQGYDITFNVTATMEVEQQLNMMLGTDTLPDLIWGIELTPGNAVVYGMEEGMLLDWSPYLNEEKMPNVMRLAEMDPSAIPASTCLDGGIYSLPGFQDRGWGWAGGNQLYIQTLMVDTTWMSACGIEKMPADWDEFLDMLRTFKTKMTLEDGKEVIPLVTKGQYMENALWAALGYYGRGAKLLGRHGTALYIKDGEVYLPCATEDYRTYIEYMKTMYDEGLISKDYLTMDDTTVEGLIGAGQCGVMSTNNLGVVAPDTFGNWKGLTPMTAGDNDKVVGSVNSSYISGKIWASADTEYPEVLAYMLDYIYSPEGCVYYSYGPMKGTDPLGILGGWYYNDEGLLTYDEVENGTWSTEWEYNGIYVHPCMKLGNYADHTFYSLTMAGLDDSKKTEEWYDAVLEESFEVVWKSEYTKDNADGHMRWERVESWGDNVTTVNLPTVFLSEEDSLRTSELELLLTEYVNIESAKFITGLRPLSEIEDFWKELEKMGSEEYLGIYREAYSPYMDSIFK